MGCLTHLSIVLETVLGCNSSSQLSYTICATRRLFPKQDASVGGRRRHHHHFLGSHYTDSSWREVVKIPGSMPTTDTSCVSSLLYCIIRRQGKCPTHNALVPALAAIHNENKRSIETVCTNKTQAQCHSQTSCARNTRQISNTNVL